MQPKESMQEVLNVVLVFHIESGSPIVSRAKPSDDGVKSEAK